jgi:hypothetical protein
MFGVYEKSPRPHVAPRMRLLDLRRAATRQRCPEVGWSLAISFGGGYPAEEMKAWKVGKAVGNTRNNDPSLLNPLKYDESDSSCLPLFG